MLRNPIQIKVPKHYYPYMKSNIFLSTILVLILASCNNNRTQEPPRPETPKALEDKSASYNIISKRGGVDLVESLYNELIDKDIELKKLEEQIDDLNNSKSDSIESFDEFNEKIKSYFNAANNHASTIEDSVLRGKMKFLLASNLKSYNAQVARHNELLEIISTKQMTIADLHNVLKIVKTLPLIKKYQKDNLPNTQSLEGFIKQQDKTLNLADTLVNR
jgi:hypothetical protein